MASPNTTFRGVDQWQVRCVRTAAIGVECCRKKIHYEASGDKKCIKTESEDLADGSYTPRH